jgi:hypothetical protein
MSNGRRSFLSSAGAAAVYTMAAPVPPGNAAQVPANDRLGVAFIGSGIRGTQLIDDFKPIAGLHFPAVCDLYDGCLARAKEQLSQDVPTAKDYRAILDRKDVDAVVIAVPDHLHKPLVLDALSAGKHVYIEKPLTWSIDEGPEVIRAERTSGKVLQVGSQPKTSALAAKAKELVHSGVLGKVTMIRMSITATMLRALGSTRFLRTLRHAPSTGNASSAPGPIAHSMLVPSSSGGAGGNSPAAWPLISSSTC